LVEVDVITELLREWLDPALECVAVERGPMGNSQETWFIDARDGEGAKMPLVLRRSSARGTLEHTERRAEFELLGALAAHGFPVPRVHWLEDEPSALERPYFVMDRLPGGPLRRQTPEQRTAIGRELGGWLARLHAADPAELAPALERPVSAADATRAELARWQAEYQRSRPGPVPLLGAVLAWLEVNVPQTEAPVRLLWADAGPHNLLVSEGRITGLLDWELAHLGDPLEDLGATVWACLPGTLERADVLAGYETHAGPVDRTRLRYFEALACASRSVMLLAGVQAFLAGTAPPSNAALGQHLLLENLGRAAALAGWEPAGEEAAAGVLQPEPTATLTGVARYLRATALPAVEDARVRRELKTAAALLDAAALRVSAEAGEDDAALEAAAVRAEREHSPALRARLLAGLAEQRALIGPLEELYRR
jgi:aminoglycoside phosphotransferase (APT) family kinase protein